MSALFFGAFTVIAQFVLLNVVIAVLMAQVRETAKFKRADCVIVPTA